MTCKRHKNYKLYALKVKQVRGGVWVNQNAYKWLDLKKDSGDLLRFMPGIKMQEYSNWWMIVIILEYKIIWSLWRLTNKHFSWIHNTKKKPNLTTFLCIPLSKSDLTVSLFLRCWSALLKFICHVICIVQLNKYLWSL